MKTYSADQWTLRSISKNDTVLDAPTTAYVDKVNEYLKTKSAAEIIAWACEEFGDAIALTSSFGIQSAVMLHLVTQHKPDIPVVWIDTGYLPKETYHFAADLQRQLDLNLQIYQSNISPARMEALYGRLWELKTPESHQLYGQMRKVEPMERALTNLKSKAILVGLRSEQTLHRKGLKVVHIHKGRLKICPILNWSQDDVDSYMLNYQLPYHPLKDEGYATVGDYHSSRPVSSDDTNVRATRFDGHVQECGLHVENWGDNQNEHDEITLPDDVDVVVYSKPGCKYCMLAKDAIKQQKWTFMEVIVGEDIEYPALCRLVGKKIQSVPQIFLNGEYVGGYQELASLIDTTS